MLTLSAAIRLGAMMRPQAYGWFFGDGGSCAQGAALEAVGVTCAPDDFEANIRLHARIQARWPWIQEWSACPQCQVTNDVAGTLAHLNNEHRWTREQIADWVQMIEEQQAVDSARQPALTDSASDRRGTTDCAQPVLATRAS